MFTHAPTRRRLGRLATFAALLALASAALAIDRAAPAPEPTLAEEEHEEHEGRAPTREEVRPSVEAAFPQESYAPQSAASLVLYSTARGLTLQFFRVGPERAVTVGYSEMRGVPVTGRMRIGSSRGRRNVRVQIGNWPSGLYFARLTARMVGSVSRPSSFARIGLASTASRSFCRR